MLWQYIILGLVALLVALWMGRRLYQLFAPKAEGKACGGCSGCALGGAGSEDKG